MEYGVFDSKNWDRHLGFLEVRNPINDMYYEVAIAKPFNSLLGPSTFTNEFYRVRFTNETRSEVGKELQVNPTTYEYTTRREMILTTDAPLSKLMQLKAFRLPD